MLYKKFCTFAPRPLESRPPEQPSSSSRRAPISSMRLQQRQQPQQQDCALQMSRPAQRFRRLHQSPKPKVLSLLKAPQGSRHQANSQRWLLLVLRSRVGDMQRVAVTPPSVCPSSLMSTLNRFKAAHRWTVAAALARCFYRWGLRDALIDWLAGTRAAKLKLLDKRRDRNRMKSRSPSVTQCGSDVCFRPIKRHYIKQVF